MAKFQRGLSERFVESLNEAYADADGWWHRILGDRDLFVGIRRNSLNVYYNGASLLRLQLRRGELTGACHFKFLLQEKKSSPYVRFCDGQFDLDDIASVKFSSHLANDLKAIKRASIPFHGIEAKGVHDVIRSNDNVIDTEIAFGDESSRIDVAALRENRRGVELVFYEAKHFSNSEIYGETPKVFGQIRKYRELLSSKHRAEELHESYRKVAHNIASLNGFPKRLRTLCRRAADEGFTISTDVRLLVYGFDRAQQRQAKPVFQHLAENIGDGLILTRGSPKGMTKGISR